MSPTVVLERESGHIAELRRKPFQIMLDGNSAGSIDRNQSLQLPVEPGRHRLQVKSGRYSSHEHTFEATDDANIRFLCNGAILWPRYVASLLVPTLGLRLKRQ